MEAEGLVDLTTAVRVMQPVSNAIYTVRHNYRTPSFKRHNLVNIPFIYIKISGNIADEMLSLQIWK